MDASRAISNKGMDEKFTPGLERQPTPEESMRGEVVEDDGEVFKVNEGQAQFRTLGLWVLSLSEAD